MAKAGAEISGADFCPQYQRGMDVLRFDDILADALEAGALRTEEYPLPDDIVERLKQTDLSDVPFEVVSDVICFCLANRQEDTEWIVLPVGNFDAYYGNTYFSRKWLSKIPNTILERSPQKCGICRVKLQSWLDKQKKIPII